MATLILSTVGSAVGGPIGSAIGALIGQQVDQAIFGSGSREGPRLKELAVTTSSYGQPIPRIFGRVRVPGTIIWSTELKETSTKEGGGKGKPSIRTYSYSVSFAVALSSTAIDRVGRIWADGNLLRGAAGDLKVGGAMRTYTGTGADAADGLIASDKDGSAPAFRDCAYVVFEDLQLEEFGNRIPALTFEVFASDDLSVSLGQLVPRSIGQTGADTLENALGFADEGGAIRGTLSAIDRVYPLTCVTSATGLTLACTSALPEQIPTLPPQLSTRDSDDAETLHRKRDERAESEPLALRYYDEARDYQPGVQRAIGRRADGREEMVDLPATMRAQGARELANANAHRARWRREQMVWRIGELDARIGAGSVVRLPETAGYWRVRSWEWFDRGIELSLERLAAGTASVNGSDPGTANTPPDVTATPTVLTAFEVPPDDGSDLSRPILYAAATSSGSGWRGAALFLDQSGSLEAIGSADGRRAVAGVLAAPLDASDPALLQPDASLEVELPASDLAFESTDITGLAQGTNRILVGEEVVQFLTASAGANNRWRLTGLLRGRAGTEEAARKTHTVGTSVILLDDRMTLLDPSLVPAVGGTIIAAIGRGDDSPVLAPLQNVGLSRRPPMPVFPRRIVRADGSREYCWARRARGQWRWPETNEVPLVEERESYQLGYGSIASPHALWTVSEPRFLLSSTEQAALVSTYGSGTLWVRQTGTFGQSSALLLATLN